MAPITRSFRPALFTFLNDLAENNDRQWFADHKDRYERYVKDAGLQFIRDFEPYLHEISPYFVADDRTVGGSLFRIYRDTRFSNDKTPYKTHLGIQFRHEAAKDVHAPGFYLHLDPAGSFAGVGIWRPDGRSALAIREAIVDRSKDWMRVMGNPDFASTYTLEGEALKRPPRGFPPDHALVEDLKRKDFIATSRLSRKTATAPDFLKQYARINRNAAGYMEFLTKSLGLPF
ncbi:MAG: TIGR02453 family protein [Actinomycetota bacterium]|nr:TIGR02453 family protein [Actinomycetota bacterium]